MKRGRRWVLGALVLAASAFAQVQAVDGGAGGPVVVPMAANPGGADAPAELIRSAGLEPLAEQGADAGRAEDRRRGRQCERPTPP